MRVSVTTPKGSLMDFDVDEITAPGALGEFGVLPGHVPFLSAIRPGVLVMRNKDRLHIAAVGEGVLEVARKTDGMDKVLIIIDQGINAQDVDREAAAKELTALDAELGHWKKDLGGEYRATLVRRAWAQARLDAAARLTPH